MFPPSLQESQEARPAEAAQREAAALLHSSRCGTGPACCAGT